MGAREVISVHQEPQPDGRTFQKIELGDYSWKDYAAVDDSVKRMVCALTQLGLKKGDNVIVYAETRMEWMISAIACFKCGFPGSF